MNETREELGRLISSSLGSREGEVDARAAEAVGHLDEGEGLEKLREVLSRPDQIKPWYKRWWMLGLCCVLLFIGVWFVQSVTYNTKATSLLTSNKLLNLFEKMSLKRSTYPFSDEERWLLSGESFHPIKELSPHNIVKGSSSMKQHAADYVHQYKRLKNVFPEDLLEIGETIDPDNPWYLYMAAADLVDLAVSKTKKVKKNEEDITVWEYEVIDPDKLNQGLEWMARADSMGNLKDHRLDFLEKKLEIYSQNRDHNFFSKVAFLAESAGYSTGGIEFLKLEKFFGMKFDELAETGDKEEVKKWIGIYKRFIDSLTEGRHTMIEILVARAHLTYLTRVSLRAAERVGLDDEVEKMKGLSKLLVDDKAKISELKKQGLPLEVGEYGFLAGALLGGQKSLKPLEFDSQDHLPDRYSMHSFLTRHLAVAGAVLLFILLLFVASYLLYKGKLARFFGERVLSLLTVREWVFIVLGGVVFPIILYYVVNQYTPLGVRKWNVLAAEGISIMVQFESMFMLVITASYCLLRWRLAVKSCGVVRRTDWWAWSAVASSLAAMLLIGCNGYEVSWIAFAAFGCLVYPVGFLLVRGIRGLISNERLIGVAAVNKGMIALLMLATISMALLVPFYYADEKKWIRQDTLITLNPEHLGEDSRSYRTMQAMKQELKEKLDMIR